MPTDQPNEPLKSAKHYAVKLLARREYSQLELTRKLQQRGCTQEIINAVLQWLTEKNLQSDTKFVEAYIAMRSRRGFGPLRISYELQQRGINKEIIASCLPRDLDYWSPLAIHACGKRLKSKLVTSTAERAKIIRFLQQRGFNMEQIDKVF